MKQEMEKLLLGKMESNLIADKNVMISMDKLVTCQEYHILVNLTGIMMVYLEELWKTSEFTKLF